jgi:enamine deaminase RidA (YjgF/YER057c/UK114 family)
MTINRWTGKYQGRNRAVEYHGTVWTVATAADTRQDLRGQTQQSLAIIDQNLRDAGSDKSLILSAQVYVTDISKKQEMDDVWCEWIGPDSANWPQRACLGVDLAGDTLVEIVVIAAKKND